MTIALTGGIACGKSLVAKFFNELGVQTLDADDVVHELEAPGGAAVPAIVARFGSSVLAPDGGIDRKKLASVVFGRDTRAARRALEDILHPLVRQRLLDFATSPVPHSPFPIPHSPFPIPHSPFPISIAIIPLLFESHFEPDYDIIICVSSTEDRQIDRMMRTRGYTREQAEARLAAQMPVAEKADLSDWTIHNDSTVEELKAEVQRCVAWLVSRMEKAT